MRIVRWPIRNIKRKILLRSYEILFRLYELIYPTNEIIFRTNEIIFFFFQCPLWATVEYLFSTEIGNLLQYKRVPYSQPGAGLRPPPRHRQKNVTKVSGEAILST